MRFTPGGVPHAGKWLWCPRNPKYFPFPIAFGSSNWDAEKSFNPQLGEAGHPGRQWWNGGPGLPCSNPSYTGDAQSWRNGIPAPQDNAFCYQGQGGFVLFGSALANVTYQIAFDTPGVFAWTVPAGVTSALVECWGSGGPGLLAGTPPGQSGSGGGAYAASVVALTPGHTHNVYVAWLISTPGIYPHTSAFDDSGIVTAVSGGANGLGQPGIRGGRASLCRGTVRFSGGYGGTVGSTLAGGGGSSAGPLGDGVYLTPTVTNIGGDTMQQDSGKGGTFLLPGPNIEPTFPGGGQCGGARVIPFLNPGFWGQVRITWSRT